jgi:hypothetical protein
VVLLEAVVVVISVVVLFWDVVVVVLLWDVVVVFFLRPVVVLMAAVLVFLVGT